MGLGRTDLFRYEYRADMRQIPSRTTTSTLNAAPWRFTPRAVTPTRGTGWNSCRCSTKPHRPSEG